MEIQDDVDKMIKGEIKPPSPPPTYTPPLELMDKNEIDNLRQQLNEEFLRNAITISKTELDAANKRADEKNKELIKSIVNPTPNLLIETKTKPEHKNIHNNIKKNYVLPPTMRNRLDDIIDENKKIIFQPPPKENIPNIPTEDIYIDDDVTSLTKTETKIDIGKPNFDGDNITMIPNNDKAEIKKSLLQTTIDIKNKKNTTITPDYLKESIGNAGSDLETVDYNNDMSIDDLEMVDYNNDTTVADLFEPKLETIEEGDENKNIFEYVKFVKIVYNISNDENKHDKKELRTKKTKRFNLLKKCLLIRVYN